MPTAQRDTAKTAYLVSECLSIVPVMPSCHRAGVFHVCRISRCLQLRRRMDDISSGRVPCKLTLFCLFGEECLVRLRKIGKVRSSCNLLASLAFDMLLTTFELVTMARPMLYCRCFTTNWPKALHKFVDSSCSSGCFQLESSA